VRVTVHYVPCVGMWTGTLLQGALVQGTLCVHRYTMRCGWVGAGCCLAAHLLLPHQNSPGSNVTTSSFMGSAKLCNRPHVGFAQVGVAAILVGFEPRVAQSVRRCHTEPRTLHQCLAFQPLTLHKSLAFQLLN